MKRENDDAAAPGSHQRKKAKLPQPIQIPLGIGRTVTTTKESKFDKYFLVLTAQAML
jgi:hypothetical protein